MDFLKSHTWWNRNKSSAPLILNPGHFLLPRAALSTASCVCERMVTWLVTWEMPAHENLHYSSKGWEHLRCCIQRERGKMETSTKGFQKIQTGRGCRMGQHKLLIKQKPKEANIWEYRSIRYVWEAVHGRLAGGETWGSQVTCPVGAPQVFPTMSENIFISPTRMLEPEAWKEFCHRSPNIFWREQRSSFSFVMILSQRGRWACFFTRNVKLVPESHF